MTAQDIIGALPEVFKRGVDKNVEKMINMFPELLHSENVLLDIPKDKKIKNLVYMIEVAYPATWTVEYLTKAKSGTNTNSDERKD